MHIREFLWHIPANTKHLYKRIRRWSNIVEMLYPVQMFCVYWDTSSLSLTKLWTHQFVLEQSVYRQVVYRA